MREKLKYTLSKNKGITLVALVVTIVVLLILAGISLNLVLGENGIIAKAKDAKDAYGQDAENTETALDNLYDEMLKELGEEAEKDDWYGVTDTIDLTGITEYHVTNCKELKMLANTVNEGNNFEGITVYLDRNLDLQGSESKQWTPIGTGEYINGIGNITFNGNFNGQNHYISGIYINNEDNDVGLFGQIDGNACIQKLGIINSYVYGAHAGAVVGYVVYGENSIVKNCYNMSAVSARLSAGGISGYTNVTIENCYNEGKISCTGNEGTGGITGGFDTATVKNCYNKGEIISEGNYPGGIAGWDETGSSNIENCYNLGKVSGNYAGGICGYLCMQSNISSCYNLGVIEGTTKGEIAGYATTNPTAISNCYFPSTSTNDAIGENNGATVTNVEGKTEAEMKASGFVTLLNNGVTAWKLDENNINNGYPILSWQK